MCIVHLIIQRALEIMLFVRPNGGHGGRYEIKIVINMRLNNSLCVLQGANLILHKATTRKNSLHNGRVNLVFSITSQHKGCVS